MSQQPQDPQPDLPPPLRGLDEKTLKALREWFLQGCTCPRCSWEVNQPADKIAEADKELFLRCVLGEKPFTKTYPLYDGKLQFGYAGLDGAQSRQLMLLARQLDPQASPPAYTADILCLKLLFYLRQCNKKTYEPPTEIDELAAAQAEYDTRFGKESEATMSLAVRVMQEFTMLENALIQGGLDANFWKSAGRD